ncbi:MAG: PadR family transcriptional regulator [Mycobacterium leprae]
MEEWYSQLRRGVLEYCILALIAQEPRYGYEIVTRLGEAPQLAAGEGTIYPLLRRLKKDGWLETYWQESSGGPPRQYYKLTAPGHESLSGMSQEWQQVVAAVNKLTGGNES